MKSKKYRAAAKDQDCSLNIAGVCNYDNSTTVLAHFPSESNGMGTKSSDLSAGDACSECHRTIDQRGSCPEFDDNADFYLRRAQTRTLLNRLSQAVIIVK